VLASEPTTHGEPSDDVGERRFVLHGVPWHAYVTLRDTLDAEGSRVLMTYAEGTLELMSPSNAHASVKKLIARLLEAWADEAGVELQGQGSETFRSEARSRGLEADECYAIGRREGVPDLAIEVVFSRPLVDKLAVYAGLGVPEVWVWQSGRLSVHLLVNGAYASREVSTVLRDLDLAHLASFVAEDALQTSTVRRYRAELRARRSAD
jgi:Uma2 family endonuclease